MSDSGSLKPVEATGATLEDAIESGLAILGLSRNDVIIEIVEEGSKGVLGIGARDASVRLTPLVSPRKDQPAPVSQKSDEVTLRPSSSEDEWEQEAEVGAEILRDILKKMGVRANVKLEHSDVRATDGESPWILDIQGRDLGSLIGRKGETLESLQYLLRLMVNHRVQRHSTIIVDVEGYKTRRETVLRRLAERMAAQAKQMGRTVTLEPMPPAERRIIHLTLQNDSTVRTESIGEGERRKVTIIPARSSK